MKIKQFLFTIAIASFGSFAYAASLQPQDARIISNLIGNFGIGTFGGINVSSGTIECSNQSENLSNLIETCAIQPAIRFSRTDLNMNRVFLQPGSGYRTRIIQLLRALNSVAATSHGGEVLQAGISCEENGETGSVSCTITPVSRN